MGFLDRKYKRKQVCQPCWLQMAGSNRLLPAVLEDVSIGGARIRVADQVARSLPDQFVLRFSQFSTHGRACQVRRREPGAVGVEFMTGQFLPSNFIAKEDIQRTAV